MSAPIAPAAVRPAEEGPAFDLISLGLVVFTILLIGVWTPYYFRQNPADMNAWAAVRPGDHETQSAPFLAAARWADLYLHTTDCRGVSIAFRDSLKKALELEAAERQALRDQVDRLSPAQSIAARAELSEHPEGPAERYARQWYRNRAAWLDARDARGFDLGAHTELFVLLREIGMAREADLEQEKVRRVSPDWPGLGPDDGRLPVIREHGTQQR
ncbi:MAG: hypothetical protein IT452_17690 [Planctomycetia bacterium]|nr:hypothetical protein [Planctomycetia bacterium]